MLEEQPVVNPNPLGVDIEAAAAEVSSPIYGTPGGEGMANSRVRRLVTAVQLPDRRKEEWQARNLLRESDIRQAMADGARRLHAAYMQRNYNALGFTFDPEQIEYDIAALDQGLDLSPENKAPQSLGMVLVCTVVIRRG